MTIRDKNPHSPIAAADVGDKMERSGSGSAAVHLCDSVRDRTDDLGFL